MYVDSHAHIEGRQFERDRAEMLARARQAGIVALLAIGNGDDPDNVECAIPYAEQHDWIWASVGVHPHEARLAGRDAYAKMERLVRHPRVIAWGEIGLDYFYQHSPREVQQWVFSEQLQLARAAGKPVIIHCRPSANSDDAWDDLFRLLAAHWPGGGPTTPPDAKAASVGGPGPATPPDAKTASVGGPGGGPGGILHCFTGQPEHARAALELGFMISFAGNVTYPKAQNIQQAAGEVPANRFLIETDSPYLAPIPHRGQRNEPAFVVETAAKIAELRGLSPTQAAALATENFFRFFGLPRPA
jgi:TatD DNase family protein